MAAGGVGHSDFSTGGHTSSGETTISRGGGDEAQPASAISAAAQPAPAIEDNARMGWVFLEILVALAIAVGIVWWTLPKKAQSDDQKEER